MTWLVAASGAFLGAAIAGFWWWWVIRRLYRMRKKHG